MCTLTLYRDDNSYCITMSRDERRGRGEFPPKKDCRNHVEMQYPVDEQAGGTWFGVNEFGVSIGLLNKYQVPVSESAQSRGEIIPYVLSKGDFDSCIASIFDMNLEQYNAFDLVVAGPNYTVQFTWDRQALSEQYFYENGWSFFTSSSLDYDAVYRYRREFFESWIVSGTPDSVIDGVHRWCDDKPMYAIRMERPLSRTKSIYQVRYPDFLSIDYQLL